LDIFLSSHAILSTKSAELHSLPPNCAGVHVRVRFLSPGPQGRQEPNADHEVRMPSIGHFLSSHAILSTRSAELHSFPPNRIGMHVRVRFLSPGPHGAHDPNADQEVRMPSIGHSLIMHCFCCLRSPTQGIPPYLGAMHVRNRFWTPSPQGLQLEYDDHWVNLPLIEHGLMSVQARVSSSIAGHGLPPNLAGVQSRVRFCMPAPQELEQTPHLVQGDTRALIVLVVVVVVLLVLVCP